MKSKKRRFKRLFYSFNTNIPQQTKTRQKRLKQALKRGSKLSFKRLFKSFNGIIPLEFLERLQSNLDGLQ